MLVFLLELVAEIVAVLCQDGVVFVLDHLDAGGGIARDLLVPVEGDEREGDGLVQRIEPIPIVGDTEENGLGKDIDGGASADGPARLVENGGVEGSLEQADVLKDLRNVVVFDGVALVIGLSLPDVLIEKRALIGKAEVIVVIVLRPEVTLVHLDLAFVFAVGRRGAEEVDGVDIQFCGVAGLEERSCRAGR